MHVKELDEEIWPRYIHLSVQRTTVSRPFLVYLPSSNPYQGSLPPSWSV
jgi:hypothetical protein